MPFLLLLASAKTRDPLYPFREFSGEGSLQIVLNAVMEIFVQHILLKVQQGTWNGTIFLCPYQKRAWARAIAFMPAVPLNLYVQ
jgi:hypothetical protein